MNRDRKIDAMRGLAAFFVMWVHIPIAERGIDIAVSTMMLPVFFAVSGYFLAVDCNWLEFIRKRCIKLLICWVVISYAEAYLSLSNIKKILDSPMTIFEIGVKRTQEIMVGRSVWFVPMLLVVSIISYCILRIAKERVFWAMQISIMISIISHIIMKQYGLIKVWNLSAAMTCQGMLIAGYFIKKYEKRIFNKWSPLWFVVHMLLIGIAIKFLGFTGFDTRDNVYQSLMVYLLVACSGIYSAWSISNWLSKSALLVFMGQHSLLYFAFGAHGYKIGRVMLQCIAKVLGYELTSNWIETLFICIVASIIWIIPALIVDIVCPVLNGKWLWPIFTKEGFDKNLKQTRDSWNCCFKCSKTDTK